MIERPIFTKSQLKIATNFTRIVKGSRGIYIEIPSSKIIKKNIIIPKEERWRLSFEQAYYIEFRSIDKSNVKIYLQKELVSYADYKRGYYYISIKDIYSPYFGLGKFIK